MIDRARPWGIPAAEPADIVVAGTDADLAAAVRAHPGALVALQGFRGEVARTVGTPDSPPSRASAPSGPPTALPMDVLADATGALLAVNAVVVGVPPGSVRLLTRRRRIEVEVDGRAWFDGPATTVVVAIGQYLDGGDIAPRGHPGDGRAEIQVYAVRPGQRRAMRRRLASGAHVPHPDIHETQGSTVRISSKSSTAIEADGHVIGSRTESEYVVAPGAYRILV